MAKGDYDVQGTVNIKFGSFGWNCSTEVVSSGC
jgi:hypothetical protein